MPFFRWLIGEKRELLLCLKLLLKVTYMQAFSSGRRCHDEGVTDEVKKIEILPFPKHNAFGYTSPPSSVGSLSSRRSLSTAVLTKIFKLCAFFNYSSTAPRSPFSHKRRLIYAVLSTVDW